MKCNKCDNEATVEEREIRTFRLLGTYCWEHASSDRPVTIEFRNAAMDATEFSKRVSDVVVEKLGSFR